MLSVYQHWSPLKACIVGRAYPPEFYSWITDPSIRLMFEQMAKETEEDFQAIVKKLEEFGVTVLRPDLGPFELVNNKYLRPPVTPRDTTVMIGNTFYQGVHDQTYYQYSGENCYDRIFEYVRSQGNEIKTALYPRLLNGAQVIRLGKDLYFGTENTQYDNTFSMEKYKEVIEKEFPKTRNTIVNTGGHMDGTFCPVTPGLLISGMDAPTYEKTFPGWQVVYLPNLGFDHRAVNPKLDTMRKRKLKVKNRWWIPGFEQDREVVEFVDYYMNHWVGNITETVFDLNMLIVDPKNVIVFSYNELVFKELERRGITPHIVPFRHRFFWDGGVHCVTSDLHREGDMQNYFTERD